MRKADIWDANGGIALPDLVGDQRLRARDDGGVGYKELRG